MRPVFLHIPKCAGSSVKQLLYENYGESFVFVDNSWEVRDELLCEPENFNEYLAFAGHVPLWAYASFTQLGFFALVRDPLVRHASAYAYAQRTGSHPRHFEAVTYSFEHWLEMEGEWNEQCFYLLPQVTDMADLSKGRSFAVVQATIQIYGSLQVAPLPHAERLIQSIARPYSWAKNTLPRLNVTPPHTLPEMTDNARQIIQTCDREDCQLYEWLMTRRTPY